MFNRFENWFHSLGIVEKLQCALLPYLCIAGFYLGNTGEAVAWVVALLYFVMYTSSRQDTISNAPILIAMIQRRNEYISQLEDRLTTLVNYHYDKPSNKKETKNND